MDNQVAVAKRISTVRALSLIIAIALVSDGMMYALETKTMEAATAVKLLTDWARSEGDTIDTIHRQANGDFYTKAATLGFYFEAANNKLVVRGRVLLDAASLMKYPDVMQELERIAHDEPKRVFQAQFDLRRMPWETGDQPTLYLRLDYKTTEVGESALFEQWRKLRETAYLWHRTYFGEAINPVVQRRLKRQ